jgi:hypothetical protein
MRTVSSINNFISKETPPLNVFAVVKIFSTAQKPDYSIPWQTSDILIATGLFYYYILILIYFYNIFMRILLGEIFYSKSAKSRRLRTLRE